MNNHESKLPRSAAPAIPNLYYEHLLKLRTENPAAFRLFSPPLRAAVAYYEAAKREAARLESI
jgi:hypothetical protein